MRSFISAIRRGFDIARPAVKSSSHSYDRIARLFSQTVQPSEKPLTFEEYKAKRCGSFEEFRARFSVNNPKTEKEYLDKYEMYCRMLYNSYEHFEVKNLPSPVYALPFSELGFGVLDESEPHNQV